MKTQEQRLAIATACGWHRVNLPSVLKKNRPWCLHDYDDSELWRFDSNLPDYPNNLDLMHEAEKVLTPAQFYDYASEHLPKVARDSNPISATAAQRAEAFLRTLNLWKD